ncbi:LamB/YcsF family protein [Dietzia sp.]|uniref:LamB/YcsF family protein n=1 Tax=Dietzia sp. TaxID=1871616 RepID=UPI002FD909C4
MPLAIDLNADLGESFGQWSMGDDEAMLDIVSSANVACGFHAGDPLVLLGTLESAFAHGVAVGAHVAYRDLAGFGRRYIDYTQAELEADVLYQLAAIDGMARAVGGRISYVKPHGALYNTAFADEGQAEAVASAVARFDSSLTMLGLPGSQLLAKSAAAGLGTAIEAFADRAYNSDGTLASRRTEGSVLHDPAEVAERMLALVRTGEIPAREGGAVRVDAASICTHGDSPGAVEMARAVRAALEDAGVEIRPFAGDREE